MDFFEPPPRRPEPPEPRRYRRPEWTGPAENFVMDPIGMRPHRFRRSAADGEIAPEILRFGIQFSDGRKAINAGGPPPLGSDGRPDGPLLMSRGGGGGGRRWDQRLWAWPLPPPGELLFACEWPAQSIELTTEVLDADLIRSAATRARELWPAADLPERPPPTPEP